MSYPFDCITEFMFFETTMDSADVIMVPGGSHPQFMESAAETDKTGITKDNWFLDDKKITPVMKELTKVGQYFAHHIPNWVRPLN